VTIPAGHPLFKSAEVIKNDADYTLRLHLRKAGGFYGWHAYYNDNDQLCFQFLNPAKASAAANKYGADLTGTLVMLDVGHGGLDGGAAIMRCPTCNVNIMASDLKSGRCPTCKTKAETVYDEAELNLALANALKAELESIGATVVLNRTDDSIITVNDRQAQMLEISPDICIAIHQNSNNSESVRGFFSMYYTPWSQMLASYIRDNTKETGVYTRTVLQWSAAYFMCRQPVCPTVLTENGFMSNAEDAADMIDPAKVELKAAAMAQSVADYFLAINK
jgi:N-acetylmuramoyl-L-alanine amidase